MLATKKRKTKINPDLLIINPGPKDKAQVWRKLRKAYSPEIAAIEYNKIYPGSIKVKRNKGIDIKKIEKDPEGKKALELFRKFHGKDPEYITEIDIPQLKNEEDMFFVVLGESPSESYLTDNIIPGSSKDGSIYVHPYESPDGERPLKAVSWDGKLIITVPGTHKVSDWIRG